MPKMLDIKGMISNTLDETLDLNKAFDTIDESINDVFNEPPPPIPDEDDEEDDYEVKHYTSFRHLVSACVLSNLSNVLTDEAYEKYEEVLDKLDTDACEESPEQCQAVFSKLPDKIRKSVRIQILFDYFRNRPADEKKIASYYSETMGEEITEDDVRLNSDNSIVIKLP